MRRGHFLVERFGKGEAVTSAKYLYHLTDYHGYSYTMANNALRTLRGSYISTTHDPKMNSVGGRDHYDFKFVLDGNALLQTYGGYGYTDSYISVGRNDERTVEAYDEREVGIDTREIKPFSDYLIGTILRFSLFSERGLQWILYKPQAFKGLFDHQKDAAPQAIKMLYRQLFKLRKPVWIGEQGKLMDRQEMAFIHDAYEIAKKGGTFRTGFEKLAEKYPLVSHRGEPMTAVDVRREFLAPKLVKALNGYYVNRPRNKIKLDAVRKLLHHIFETIGIGNNAVSVIMGAIEDSGLIHPATPPVSWGGIIKRAMAGDIEDTLETIKWFAEEEKRNRDWYDEATDMFGSSPHYGTSFGRITDR